MSSSSMTLGALVSELRARGIHVAVDGDRLRVSAPEGAITEELRQAIGARKAELIDLFRSSGSDGPKPRSDAGPAGLSLQQERIWLLQEMEPHQTAYNLSSRVALEGELDVPAFHAAVRRVLERHEPLRTTLVREGGDVTLRTVPISEEVVREVDLTRFDAEEQLRATYALVQEEQGKPFRLADELPVRVTLVRHSDRLHHVIAVFHHTASDGASLLLFFRDVMAFYGGKELPALPVTYSDVSAWERHQWSEGRVDAELAFWTDYLDGAPLTLDLPTDRPRPARQTFAGSLLTRTLPKAEEERLRAFLAAEGVTLFSSLLASFAAALHRGSGQRDFVLGTPVGSRGRPELREMIGMFVNQIPLRVQVERGVTFRDLVSGASHSSVTALGHQDVPFPLLAAGLQPTRDQSRTPLFQAVVNVVPGADADVVPGAGGIRVKVVAEDSAETTYGGHSRFDLSLYAQELVGSLELSLLYNPDLFGLERMEWLFDDMMTVLREGPSRPDVPLRDLITPDVPAPLVERARDEGDVGDDLSVAERFEAIVAQHSARPALLSETATKTYGELAAEAHRVARRLSADDTGDGPIGVLLPTDDRLAASVLGALRAGRPYVPLDPTFPAERLRLVVSDSGATAVLSVPELRDLAVQLVDDGVRLVDFAEHAEQPLPHMPPADAVAYVMYTSGSTGRPKGVVQSQGNLARQADRYAGALALTADDRLVLAASPAHDAFLMDFFGGLLSGSAMIPADLREVSVASLPDLVRGHLLTVLHLTPTVFRALARTSGSERLESIRAVVLGGEPVRPGDIAQVDQLLPDEGLLLNLYGCTEHSFALGHRVDRSVSGRSEEVPIGAPMGDVEVLLLDEDGRPDPIKGELVLLSDRSALGYWRRDEESAGRFSEVDGRRRYRTGDVVRRRPDGSYVFLHRRDGQLKVRGHRVEPEGVETVLLAHPNVKEVSVYGSTTSGGDTILVACVALGEGSSLDEPALRAWSGERLPSYSVPTAWTFVDALPRTPTGKVDRAALPAPDRRTRRSSGFVAPRSEVEVTVAEVWGTVLGLEAVGIHDEFFNLGGHSLDVVDVTARIRDELGVDVSLRDFFDRPTVAQIAALIEGATQADTSPIPAQPADADVRLTVAQERLWTFQQLDPLAATFNMSAVARLEGPLNLDRLSTAVTTLLSRHEALRSVVVRSATGPVQRVVADVDDLLRIEDLEEMSAHDASRAASYFVRQERQRPFALERDIPFRALLMRHGERTHDLVLSLHHMFGDGESMLVLFRDLLDLYAGRSPADLPITFRDYAAWHREQWTPDALTNESDFWTEYLRDAPLALDLPTDRPRPPVQSYSGGNVSRQLDTGLSDRLYDLLSSERASLFNALLVGLASGIHRMSGQRDLVLGAPVAGRTRTEFRGMVGMFVNQVPIRVGLEADASFRRLLRTARDSSTEVLDRAGLPFAALLDIVRPPRDRSRPPVFQAAVNVLPPIDGAERWSAEELELVAPSGDSRRAMLDVQSKLDFTLYAQPIEGRVELILVYNRDLYAPERAEEICQHVERLLRAAVERPDAALDELVPHGAGPDRPEALLVRGAPVGEGFDDAESTGSIIDRFRRVCDEGSDELAVVGPAGSLTYGALRTSAEAVAAVVADEVKGGGTVGVFLPHDIELAPAVMGVLTAGAAYVPLDPRVPDARLTSMGEAGALRLVLTSRLLEERARTVFGSTVVIRVLGEFPETEDERPAPDPASLAYVMFTSGSTGEPKAVMQSQERLLRQVVRYGDLTALSPGDRVSLVASTSFDAFLMDFFGALLHGAELHVLDLNELDLAELPGVLTERDICVLHLTPSVLRTLSVASGHAPLPSVRSVVLGGEPVRPADVSYLSGVLSDAAAVFNLYGCAEHSFAIGYEMPRDLAHTSTEVPIGRPVGDVDVRLIGPEGREDEVRGEIVLSSRSSALGYWGNEAATGAAFRPDEHREGAWTYRTGDVARRRPDGTFVLLHRSDDQLKIRGHRVEPGEVEAMLMAHPHVREAAVHGPIGRDESVELAACVVLEPGSTPSPSDLSAWCAERLPSYLVPTGWVMLDDLPRTRTGKVDRKSLPAPDGSRSVDQRIVRPRDASEETLAQIFAEVLGRPLEEIGVFDDFFQLGGQSLSATQVVARVRDVMGVTLELQGFFERPTVAATADLVQRRDAPSKTAPPLAPAPEGPVPLSFSQERMWFMQELAPEATAYNVTSAFQIDGPLDQSRLVGALEALVVRHEALRSRVGLEDRRPRQTVLSESPPEIVVEDFRDLPEADRLEAVRVRAGEVVGRPYDLAKDSPLRAALFRLGDARHVLAFCVHHALFDQWSRQIFLRELASIYNDPTWLERSPPPEIRYRDYAAWQRGWLVGDALEEEVSYWREQLDGLKPLDLPTDFPRPPFQTFNGQSLVFPFPPGLEAELERVARDNGVTVFIVLLAAFNLVLSAHSGQDDIAVGVPIANRKQRAVEDVIGTFVNTLVLRNDVKGELTLREFIRSVRDTAVEAFGHQDVPFEALVRELDVARDTSVSPLFQVLFNVANAPVDVPPMDGLQVRYFPYHRFAAQFDLTVSVTLPGGADSGLMVKFNTDLYTEATTTRLIEHFFEILARGLKDPGRTVRALSTVPDDERDVLVEQLNDTRAEYPLDADLVELLQETAAREPKKVAIRSVQGEWTYAELMEQAGRVSAALDAMGVGEGDRVAVVLDRGRQMMAALIGILGTGASYVPVDPAYPESRVRYVLESASVAAAVSRGDATALVSDVPVLDLEQWTPPAPIAFKTAPASAPAYAIYTSGSTGNPKGVEIPRRAMLNFLFAMRDHPGLGSEDTLLAVTTISFDIAVLELFLPLLVGATVVVASEEETIDGARLASAIEREGVTVMQATPATWKLLLSAGWPGADNLRVLCGGEPLPSSVAEDLLGRVAELWNMYGPTETTVWSTVQRIESADDITIGRPIGNTTLYVLDEDLHPVPRGVPGELWIGGEGVANGYVGRPDLTEERFVTSPFRVRERMYRTGDLVRYRNDGRLEHLGRLDHQVKVRGFRIELGEVEATLRAHEGIRDAVVVATDDRLLAYVVNELDAP
ncbi:MAG: amino acid adenylation domain-containing protein, partial [Gemmatimonadota bacterium]